MIAIPIFQINIADLSNTLSDYSDPYNLNFLKYLQTIQAIGLFIIPAFIIAYLFYQNSLEYLKLKTAPNALSIGLCIFILLSA